MENLNPITTIQHIIIVPASIPDEETTFFQGFSRSIVEKYPIIFYALCSFPYDILDIFLTRKIFVKTRVLGISLNIHFVREDLINDLHIDFNRPFSTIWSTESTYKSALKAYDRFIYKPFHISTNKNKNNIYIDDINNDLIKKIFKTKIIEITRKNPQSGFSKFLKKSIDDFDKKKKPEELSLHTVQHNVVSPIQQVLRSYGYTDVYYDTFEIGSNKNNYIKEIISLSTLLDKIINIHCDKNIIKNNDALIFSSSMFSYLYNTNSPEWKKLFRETSREGRNFIKNMLVRNTAYSGITFKQNEKLVNFDEDELVLALLSERQKDLHLFTLVISIVSVSQFCPAFRLPNSVMLHHDILNDISSLITSSSDKSLRKLKNKIKNYSDILKLDIGENLINESLKKRNKIISICDFPIEWLSIDDTPIMFTHEISRILPTPGNILNQMALNGQKIIIPYDSITNILIIRSFDEEDPIKNCLSSAIEVFSRNGACDNLSIKIIDTYSEVDLIDAINNNPSAILIFDCHGDHGGIEGHAWLNIGDEEIDIWQLANKCPIPPIVILSACNTHPINGSHASVANGLFRCGALSVIGTYAPVKATHAGVFVARLLYRLAGLVPIIISEKRVVSWREIVTGFLKMSYATDILVGFKENEKNISKDEYLRIHFKTNFIINSNESNWINKFYEIISEEANIDKKTIKNIINKNYQYVDTMLYTQLGRPENIIIK